MHGRQLGLGVSRHLQEPRRGVPSWVSPGLYSSSFFVTKRDRVRRFKPVVNSDDDGLLRMVVRLWIVEVSVELPKHYGDETLKDSRSR